MKKQAKVTVIYPVSFDILRYAQNLGRKDILKILQKMLKGKAPSEDQIEKLRTFVLNSADQLFETSTIEPLIHGSDFDVLVD